MGVAAGCFHLAYLVPACAFLIGAYAFALLQLPRQRTPLTAMNTGWVLTFLVYAPHLSFFWTIFGPAALALWLVLGFWLALFLVLTRFVREHWGEAMGLMAAPVFWIGL